MAFLVKKEYYNTYRCPCCIYISEFDEWHDKLEDALKEIPDEFPTDEEVTALKSISVIDGSTSDTIAEMRADWPPNYRRGDAYKYTQFTKFMPDSFYSEIVKGRHYSKGSIITDKTWEQICEELRKEANEVEIRQTERELEETKRKLERLKNGA